MIKIIMIEDDNEIAVLLKEYLRKFNMELTNFENPKKGLESIKTNDFDLLILDLTLPDIDGLEVCKIISETSDIPIIISSARNDDVDIVTGLELGADDYIAKPYNPRELVARIRSITRRKCKRQKDADIKDFEIDENSMLIKKNGEILHLTPAEYELLTILLKNKDRVVTRDFILENLKTMSYESVDRSVDVLIGRLRKKISDDPKNPRYIKSVRGYGYKLVK
ncbi:MAG: response regulator transcription factor [bacterium]